MKKVLAVFLLSAAVLSAANPIDKKSCSINGIKLAGKVKVVKSFPDDCGEWQFVESFPDFTIKYVDSFPDFTIRMTDSFPGVK